MPCLVMRPTSITSPIWLYTLSVAPVSFSASSAPVAASGTVSMMMKGEMKLSNCAASTR